MGWEDNIDLGQEIIPIHFAALHCLVHVEEGAVPLDERGTVAFVRLIKPPGVTDHRDA